MALQQSHEVIDRQTVGIVPPPAHQPPVVSLAGRWDHDPLDPDAAEDETVTTSPRRLLRLVIAAAETGARFAREGIDQDPAAWMLTPRAVFDGVAPIEACQDLRNFNRSIVFHAISTGLDADPRAIDALLDEDDEDAVHGDFDGFDGFETADADTPPVASEPEEAGDLILPEPLLLTCWLDVCQNHQRLFAFCALVTDRPADLIDRVIRRYGRDAAHAEFAVGYDHTAPLATAMISEAMAETLALATADPQSVLAAGLDVVVEQRFLDGRMAA